MKKKGVVYFAAGMALLFIWGFVPVETRPMAVAASGQSAKTNVLAEKQFAEAVRLLKQENFDDAIGAYEKVIALIPESAIAQDARYWIGQTYLRMGKYDEALSVFKKLLKDYPGSAIEPVTKLMLSRVQQEKENAVQRAQRAEALDQKVIVDPDTRAEFKKVKVLRGKSDVIDYVMSGVFLSPNGKFLLNHKTVIPLDGQEPFDLVDEPALRSIWSPDGKKVAFFLENAIWVIPVSPETGRPTGPAKKLLDGKYRFENPVSWSPDSEKIVFTRRDEKTEGDIWTLSIKDGVLTQITDDEAPEHGASWSADGKTIAYVKGSETWAVAADGGNPRMLSDKRGLVFWSPDGRYLVLMTRVYRPNLFRLADQRLFAIEPPEGVGQFLSWSSDSKKLLFYRSSYDYSITLRVVSSNGGPTFELGRDLKLWPYFHDWSPDSQWIITAGQDRPLWMIPLGGGEAVPIQVDRHDQTRRRDAPTDESTGGQFNMGSLSPDCKKLLFSLDRDDGKEDLFVAPFSLEEARTTGLPVEIMKGWERHRGLKDYSWSSDSHEVAFIHKGDIWVTSVDKARLVQVTDTPEVEKLPVWAPHGEMIAFIASTKAGEESLRTVLASGGVPRLVLDPCHHWRYAWSPNGKKLVAESKGVISIITFPGGDFKKVVDLGREGFEGALGFSWFPDGKRFAFISNKGREAPTRIYVVPAEGGNIAELAGDDDNWKDWLFPSPDGKWVSYDSEGTVKTRPEGSIWEVNVEDLLKGKE
jgi:Tol biopolymer transport system component